MTAHGRSGLTRACNCSRLVLAQAMTTHVAGPPEQVRSTSVGWNATRSPAVEASCLASQATP